MIHIQLLVCAEKISSSDKEGIASLQLTNCLDI